MRVSTDFLYLACVRFEENIRRHSVGTYLSAELHKKHGSRVFIGNEEKRVSSR